MLDVIIQARVGSTRLPGKVLKKVLGKTILEHEISRIKRSKKIDKIVLATTVSKKDDPLEEAARKLKVGIYRGSEEDVLDRYYQAALKFELKNIMRITGDCPLVDWNILDKGILFYETGKFDYINSPPELAEGMDFEIVSFPTLKKCWENAKLLSEREHVTPYIKKHPELFKLGQFPFKKDYSHIRLTIDEPRDLVMVRKVFSYLYPDKKFFTFDDVLKLFEYKPELLQINSDIVRNEGYVKSLKNDKLLK